MNKSLALKEEIKETTCAAQKCLGLQPKSSHALMLSQWTMLSLCQQFAKEYISKIIAVDLWVQNQQFQSKSMANFPVVMKWFYGGCGIWINLSPVMLKWMALLLPFPGHSLTLSQ